MTIESNFSSDPTLTVVGNLADLQRYFGTYDATLGALNRRLYKDTKCGAHLSVQSASGTWHHNGEDDWMGPAESASRHRLRRRCPPRCFRSGWRGLVLVEELNAAIASVESEANVLWHEANDTEVLQCSLCGEVVCNHEVDEHSRFHSSEQGAYEITWHREDA